MRTNTIFGRSHIPLNKWLYAVYIVVTARKGMSSLQLSKEIGVTQKTVWFMLGRLREACGGDIGKLDGIVEIDETYIGGKCPNMSNAKRKELTGTGCGAVGKQAVMGMRERGGRSKAMLIEGTSRADLHSMRSSRTSRSYARSTPTSTAGIAAWKTSHTSTAPSITVPASTLERTISTSNSAESMWAVLKRGLYGTWHKA